jgi:mannose-6-phosphate isomerase-like protein (cupin superfamily)
MRVYKDHERVPDLARARLLFDALEGVSPEEAKRALDEREIDPVVGIAITKMKTVPVEFEGQSYDIYAARVLPGRDSRQPCVTPHLHKVGCEPYYFLDGHGEMHFGDLSPDGKTCNWRAPIKTDIAGKVLIGENEVHSLRNTGECPAHFLFACPQAHLIDHSPEHPEGDRYLIPHASSQKGSPFGKQ